MASELESQEMTEECFWKEFWQNQKLPQKANYNLKNDRVICESIKAHIPSNSSNSTCLEIGCAPGKWMIFMAESLGYYPLGIEYVASAAEATRKNLDLTGIKGNVLHTDFFKFFPTEKHDVVMSFGFIEHFTNTDEVIQKHIELIKDDGFLVLGIPRFRGIGYFIQKVIDRDLSRPLIPAHNLDIMEKNFFNSTNSLKHKTILFNDYVGGFEPSLFPVGSIKNSFVRLVIRVIIKLCDLLFSKLNSHWTASYQMIIVKNKSS